MIKKTAVYALTVCLFLNLLSPAPVKAQGELTILANSAEARFPLALRFNLSAESDVDITDIRLHYTIDRESYARVSSEAYIEFTPDTKVSVEWVWDMRRTGGLPPGTTIEYWWTVIDDNDNKIETTPVSTSFDDERYSWKSLTEDKITIYWYDGDLSFARAIMLTAQQSMERLAEDTGARLKKPVRLYIYASARDLQGSMIFPQEWTGGVAFTRYGVIVIGISPNNLAWGKRATTHELTHLVVHQMTFNPYTDLPAWLNEGLAMYAEGGLEPSYRNILKKAIEEKSIISVRSLSSPFSAKAEESYLSYAQSYSLVEFLVTGYGQSKMLELLNTFSEGSSYDGSLEKTYGFNMDGLNSLWREKVTAPGGLTDVRLNEAKEAPVVLKWCELTTAAAAALIKYSPPRLLAVMEKEYFVWRKNPNALLSSGKQYAILTTALCESRRMTFAG